MIGNKVIEVQGMRFRLKPTTRRNVQNLQETFNSPSDALLEKDQYEQYIELLRVIAEPADEQASFDKIDPDDFDIKIAEQALLDFIPTLMATYGGLLGS